MNQERAPHLRLPYAGQHAHDAYNLGRCREEHAALRRLVQDLRVKLEDAEARCRRANRGEDEAKERLKALQSKQDGVASEVSLPCAFKKG